MSDPLVIRIHPDDDVVIARRQLVGGTRIESEGITVVGLIPPGHKVATRAIAAGEPVRRYDQIIGSAKQAIAPGQHVHTHNLEFSSFARDYAAASGAQPTEYVASAGDLRRHRPRRRPHRDAQLHRHPDLGELLGDGRARDRRPLPRATPTRSALERFPNVDGVVALTHGAGCATDSAGEPLQVLRRTLGGYARHANFASVLVVGLGCETNQISGLMEQESGWRDSGPALHASTSRRPAARRRRSRTASSSSSGCSRSQRVERARRCRRATSWSACSAAAPTATRGSAPTRRSAPRSTGWCATAAPRSSPRRPRSTAASTC